MTSAEFGEPVLRESLQDPLKQLEPTHSHEGNPEGVASLLLNTHRIAASAPLLAHNLSTAAQRSYDLRHQSTGSCRLWTPTLSHPPGKELYARI
jgi:hypothetical protein